jgi:uncharacterized membrane protein YdjX (TVP38/TMEM64 family)
MRELVRKATDTTTRLFFASLERYRRLKPVGKVLFWVLCAIQLAFIALLFIYTPERIFQYIYDLSQRLREQSYGWVVVAVAIALSSIPPIVGHGTSMMLCGFAYGVQGFIIAAPAAIVGASLGFVIYRYILTEQVKQWTANSNKWKAFESVIEARGLPLIILIRFCPLPWSYSNAFLGTLDITYIHFLIATICLMPKLLLHIFIASRIAALSNGRERAEMDTLTKFLNGAVIAAGIAVGVGTGWFMWRLTNAEIRKMRGNFLEAGVEGWNEDPLASAPLLTGSGILTEEEDEETV